MNSLTERLGPFPVYIWVLIVTVLVVLYLTIRKPSAAKAANQSSQSQMLSQQEAALSAQQSQAAAMQNSGGGVYGGTGISTSINGYNGQAQGRLSLRPSASQSSFNPYVPTTAPVPGGN